jgi:hypothetical protein
VLWAVRRQLLGFNAARRPIIGSVDDLTRAWRETEEQLPKGWHLDGLRCASTSLRPEDRSDDWLAVAVSADGEERQHRASDPLAALAGLIAAFRAN